MANTPVALKNFQPYFRMPDGSQLNKVVQLLNSSMYLNSGAPVDGTTGKNVIPAGALLIDTTNKTLYQNTGTKASPAFTIFESSGGTGVFTTIHATGAVTFDTTALVKGVLSVGVQGTLAGEVDLNSPAAASGKFIIKAANSAGAFNTTLINASMAAARVFTIPDPGADSKLVVGGGNAAVALTGTGGTSTGTMTTASAKVTTGAISTAAAASHVATITYTGVVAGDIALVSPIGGTNTKLGQEFFAICTTNTITVTIYNGNAASVDGNIVFALLVVKA